jgi:hypothetical protein
LNHEHDERKVLKSCEVTKSNRSPNVAGVSCDVMKQAVMNSTNSLASVSKKKKAKVVKRKKRKERKFPMQKSVVVLCDDDDDFEVDTINKSKVVKSPRVCDKITSPQPVGNNPSMKRQRSGGVDKLEIDGRKDDTDRCSEPETLEFSQFPSLSQPMQLAPGKCTKVRASLRVCTPPHLEELDILFDQLGSRDRLSPVDILQLVDIWEAEKALLDDHVDAVDRDTSAVDFDTNFQVNAGINRKTKMSVSVDAVKMNPFVKTCDDELPSLDDFGFASEDDGDQIGDSVIGDVNHHSNTCTREKSLEGQLFGDCETVLIRSCDEKISKSRRDDYGHGKWLSRGADPGGLLGDNADRVDRGRQGVRAKGERTPRNCSTDNSLLRPSCPLDEQDRISLVCDNEDSDDCDNDENEPRDQVQVEETSWVPGDGSQIFDPVGFEDDDFVCDVNIIGDEGQLNICSKERSLGRSFGKGDLASIELKASTGAKKCAVFISESTKGNNLSRYKSSASVTDITEKENSSNLFSSEAMSASVADEVFHNMDLPEFGISDSTALKKQSRSTNSSSRTTSSSVRGSPAALKRPLFNGGSAERHSGSLWSVVSSDKKRDVNDNSVYKAKRVNTPVTKDSSVQEAFSVSFSLFDEDFADEISVHGANSFCRRPDAEEKPFKSYANSPQSETVGQSKGKNKGEVSVAGITPIKKQQGGIDLQFTPSRTVGVLSPLVPNVTSTPMACIQPVTSLVPNVTSTPMACIQPVTSLVPNVTSTPMAYIQPIASLVPNMTSSPVACIQPVTSESPGLHPVAKIIPSPRTDGKGLKSLPQNPAVAVPSNQMGNITPSLFDDDDDDDQLLAAVCDNDPAANTEVARIVKSDAAVPESKQRKASNTEDTQVTFSQALNGVLASSESPEDIDNPCSRKKFPSLSHRNICDTNISPVSNSDDGIVLDTPVKVSNRKSTLYRYSQTDMRPRSNSQDKGLNDLPSNGKKSDHVFVPIQTDVELTARSLPSCIGQNQRTLTVNDHKGRDGSNSTTKQTEIIPCEDDDSSSSNPSSPSLLSGKTTKSCVQQITQGNNSSSRFSSKRKIKFEDEANLELGNVQEPVDLIGPGDVQEAVDCGNVQEDDVYDLGDIDPGMFDEEIYIQGDEDNKQESCGFHYSPQKTSHLPTHESPRTPGKFEAFSHTGIT